MIELTEKTLKVAEEFRALDRAEQLAVIESVLGDHSVCRTMLAATGRLPAPTADEFADITLTPKDDEIDLLTPRTGVQYIPGLPPTTPVLKKIRQPLIDTERYQSFMARVDLFADNTKFCDGRPKSMADTNMTQSGMLGYPLEYDISRLELHLDGEHDDIKRLMPTMSLTLYFGCNTPWFRVPAVSMRPIIDLPNLKLKRRSAKKIADAFADRGYEFGHYWAPVCSPDKPKHITGIESFRVGLEFSGCIAVSREVRIQVALQDTLYAML